MIISIAMLGIGASGTILSLNLKLKNPSYISVYSLLLGISISASYLISNQIPFDPVRLSWSSMQLFYIGLYYIILSTPFFFAGLIIATALSSLSGKSGLFYGADLLGAGVGSIGILYFMTATGPENTVFILSFIALIAALAMGNKMLRAASLVFIMLNILLTIFRPDFINIRMSPYKGLPIALRYPGAEHLKTYFSPFSKIDTFKSPAVRFAPGLSLKYLDTLPEQIGLSIDGSEINAITSAADRKSLTFLHYLPSALPYEIRNSPESPYPPFWKRGARGDSKGVTGRLNDVLILDPKGGLQCLVAEHYGSLTIYKIESNPLLIKVIKKDFDEFSGSIYAQNTWQGLGRSWLRSDLKQLDIIDISLTGTMPSGSFGISEDYRFTVEGFKEYFYHLKDEGFLSIHLFILPPPRIELRLITTLIASMEELGINDIQKHFVALRSWGSIGILVKKNPFTLNEIEAIKQFSKGRRFDLIYYPGIKEEETNIYIRIPSNEYFTAFKNILNPETRLGFIDDYIFDISPVRDDYPFFHYYLKLKNIKAIYTIMGEKWQYFIEEGFILPVVFIQVLFLSLILVLLPAFSKKYENDISDVIAMSPDYIGTKKQSQKQIIKSNNEIASAPPRIDKGKSFLPYFAFLGIGFMFIEISLIQKMILPLENPSYAVATVLTSILISSGVGSLLSHRVSGLRNPVISLVITFLIFLYSIFIPAILNIISPYSILIKITLVFLILIPLGLLMGIPFPTGLKILGEKNKLLIPWAWAINGCLSVLAPILTIILAMVMGFKSVLWLGALAYLMAFIMLKNASKN
ncbi:MAG: hypothetical protein OEZ31_02340 [Nitrospirota bacterium]|nr:hypothetical protein [Nitrospirota bacterium]